MFALIDPHLPPRITPSYVDARVSVSVGLLPPSSLTASLKSTSAATTPSTSAHTSSCTVGSLSCPSASSTLPLSSTTSCCRAVTTAEGTRPLAASVPVNLPLE
eukprot:4954544-Pleurochrysis_carterae.AAC.2